MTNNDHVQFGCGFTAPVTWRNFDASPTLRFERLPVFGRLYTKNERRFPANVEYGDILVGLPVPAGSCTGVFCSHVLQDMPVDECRIALKQTFELMRPGGIFRLVVPDLEYSARRYVESNDPLAAVQFMREGKFGVETGPRRLYARVIQSLESSLGSRQRWMWDFKSFAHELRQIGFHNIRRCEIGDCADPLFGDVEVASRFLHALAIECAKP